MGDALMKDLITVAETMQCVDLIRRVLLRNQIADVSAIAADCLGFKRKALGYAVEVLEKDGYRVWYLQFDHKVDKGKKVSVKLLAPSNITETYIRQHPELIKKIYKENING
jgi:hypothetical protein